MTSYCDSPRNHSNYAILGGCSAQHRNIGLKLSSSLHVLRVVNNSGNSEAGSPSVQGTPVKHHGHFKYRGGFCGAAKDHLLCLGVSILALYITKRHTEDAAGQRREAWQGCWSAKFGKPTQPRH